MNIALPRQFGRISAVALFCFALLPACGGGGGSTSIDSGSSSAAAAGGGSSGGGTGGGGTTVGGTGASSSRTNMTYDVMLPSNLDGEIIAFTIHEPDNVVAGQVYPLILHSHGYAGSRQASRPESGLLGRFLDNGYGILTLDERGNGESGGTVRILDPNFEGQDWLQVLDWTEENLEWMAYRDGNPLLGAVGGSYGGGYQHMVYAIDPEHRLDAIAPDITWHDLRYSLFSGGVFKTTWATLLGGLGNRPPNRQDTEVNQGLQEGLTTNSLAQSRLDLLYQNSLISHCEGMNSTTAPGGLTRIDSFITQSHLDTLFNFNDAYGNYECVSALGGDVRLFTKSAGHGLDNGDGGQNCAALERDEATFQWYEEKLMGVVGAANIIPDICLNLSKEGADGIVVNDITVGGTDIAPIAQQTMTLGTANVLIVDVPIYTAPAGGEVLAGIPTIELTMLDPLLGAGGLLDPIVFVGIGYAPAGSTTFTDLMNQVTPFRGYGTHQEMLVGIMQRLAEGDQLSLRLHPSHAQQYATSASTAPTTVTIDATVSLPLIGSSLAP